MKRSLTFLLIPFALIFNACGDAKVDIKDDQKMDPEKHEVITLGGGCYWCVEAVFQQLDGVISATSGFMGGHVANPTYEDVCLGFTGHVEVVQVAYDPEKISVEKILEWFWKSHDPTDARGQGADQGPMYMSHIFYHNEEQKKAAEASKAKVAKMLEEPVVTKIKEASEFYTAPKKHQDYYENNSKKPYCAIRITPKLKKLNLEH